jgi:type I restriction enzyme R subunit
VTVPSISKKTADDPTLDEKKAKRAIARFIKRHPHNLEQKTEIMVEHFKRFTQAKIGGKAKAMLVTASRLQAVRYKQTFDKYIKNKGYTHIKTLVAFSGTVENHYTEANMNGFREKQLPAQFHTPNYQILIVAEKYQTGFDEPLLHTLFIDKKLAELKAVQTLSRVNRTCSGKEDTFILDFVNDIEDIKNSFKPYFEMTSIDQPTDPNQLYTLQSKIEQFKIIRPEEINAFAEIFYKEKSKQDIKDHAALNKWIDPAAQRFKRTKQGEDFKSHLQAFIRLYSFMRQIIDWQDINLEKLYSYSRYLLTKLPYRDSNQIDLDQQVLLTSYRNEKTFEGNAALNISETASVYGTTAASKEKTPHHSPLSDIIQQINERFGTHLTEQDKLVFEQIAGKMATNENLSQRARENSKEQFRIVLEPEVMQAFIERLQGDEKIVDEFMQNNDIRAMIINALLDDVYEQANRQYLARDAGASELGSHAGAWEPENLCITMSAGAWEPEKPT